MQEEGNTNTIQPISNLKLKLVFNGQADAQTRSRAIKKTEAFLRNYAQSGLILELPSQEIICSNTLQMHIELKSDEQASHDSESQNDNKKCIIIKNNSFKTYNYFANSAKCTVYQNHESLVKIPMGYAKMMDLRERAPQTAIDQTYQTEKACFIKIQQPWALKAQADQGRHYELCLYPQFDYSNPGIDKT